MKRRIPLYKPFVNRETASAVLRVLESRKLSRGKEVENFERKFAAFVGKRHAIAHNSGTSALHVAVRALGWKKGDEVITTPFSYIASGNALLFEDVTPVFVDIDPRTLNIDVRKIKEKITPRTKGILLVHILGLPVDHLEIRRIAEKHGLKVLEDACEAVGKASEKFPVGSCGDISVYGFHENKQLTTAGEGGMAATDDARLARLCWSMRDQGRANGKDWIKRVTLGFNFRMTEMQAAYGTAQLKGLKKQLATRESIARKYYSYLKDVKGVTLPQDMDSSKRSWFLYFILLKNEKARNKVYEALKTADIASSTNYFPPIYSFPMYAKIKREACPNTDKASKTLLALPTFVELTGKDIERIASVIKKALN